MSKFLYYCPNCNKLYMAGEAGKTLKCTGCSEIALDMGISSDEYNALNTAQKQELKNRIILKYSADEDFAHDASDGGIKEQETTVDKPGTEAAGSNDTEVKNDSGSKDGCRYCGSPAQETWNSRKFPGGQDPYRVF